MEIQPNTRVQVVSRESNIDETEFQTTTKYTKSIEGEETASSSSCQSTSSRGSMTWNTKQQTTHTKYQEASSSYLEVHSDDKIDASVSGLAGALSAFTKSGAKPKWLKCSLCGYECWPPNARHHLFKCPVLKHSPELRHKVLPNPTPPPPPEESRNLYAREEDNPYYFTRINTAPGYLCNNCGLGLRGAHRPRHLRSCWKRGKLEKSGEKRKIEKSSFSTEEYIDAVGSSDAAKSPGRPKRTNFCGQSPTWLSVVEDIPPTCIHHEKEEIRKLPTLTSVFVLSVGDRWTRREVDDGQLSVDNLCR